MMLLTELVANLLLALVIAGICYLALRIVCEAFK